MSDPTTSITREMILGAKITDVWCAAFTKDDLDYATCYFTCDRGFSFCLPCGGTDWNAEPIPSNAKKLEDVKSGESIGFGLSFRGIFGLQGRRMVLDDSIQRLKQSSVARVLCGPFDAQLGFFDPFETVMVMSDGFCVSCLPVAPHGTGSAGLYYRSMDIDQVAKMTDFFDIRVES